MGYKRILANRVLGKASGKSPVSKKQLCIFKPDRIGDMILATGIIRKLVQEFGSENCTCVISIQNQEWFNYEFPGVETIGFNFDDTFKYLKMVGWRSKLGNVSFEQAVSLRYHKDALEELVAQWIKSKTFYSIHADDELYRPVDPIREEPLPGDYSGLQLCRELEFHHAVLSRMFNADFSRTEIVPKLTAKEFYADIKDYILISPFGKTRIRDLPVKHLKLIREIDPEQSWILAGTERQRDRLLKLASELGGSKENISVAESAGAVEFFRLIRAAKGVISTETATAHAAAAFDKPLLGFLGGGHYGLFAPWSKSDRQVWLNHFTECYNCQWQCPYRAPHCIHDISANDIRLGYDRFVRKTSDLL